MTSALRTRLSGLKGVARSAPHSFRQLRDVRADLAEWKRAWDALSSKPLPAPDGETTLLCSVGANIGQAKIDSLLAHALRRRGHRVIFLLQRGQQWPFSPEPYYRATRLGQIAYWDDFDGATPEQQKAIRSAVTELLENSPTADEVLRFRMYEADCGVHALSTISRTLRSGRVDPASPEVRVPLSRILPRTADAAVRARRIIEQLGVHRVGFIDRGYWLFGPFCDAALAAGCDVIQLVGALRDDAFVLKRYTEDTKRIHPNSLSTGSFQRLRARGWSPAIREAVQTEQNLRYQGKWYVGSREQTGKPLENADRTHDLLELDPTKKTATVFSHILWDANLFYGEDVFDDFGEWLIETVRAAYANPNINWLIKLHPANIWKAKLEGMDVHSSELDEIRNALGEPPQHVKIIPADYPLNTFSFMEVSDFCITVRGTIGMEMAARGARVILAGTGRYSNFGFTNDCRTREEYMRTLQHLHEMPPLPEEERRLAELYAYGVFERRPWRLTSARRTFMDHGTTKHPLFYNMEMISPESPNHEDLDLLGEWLVNSRDEDYLAPDPIGP